MGDASRASQLDRNQNEVRCSCVGGWFWVFHLSFFLSSHHHHQPTGNIAAFDWIGKSLPKKKAERRHHHRSRPQIETDSLILPFPSRNDIISTRLRQSRKRKQTQTHTTPPVPSVGSRNLLLLLILLLPLLYHLLSCRCQSQDRIDTGPPHVPSAGPIQPPRVRIRPNLQLRVAGASPFFFCGVVASTD